jgi:transposase
MSGVDIVADLKKSHGIETSVSSVARARKRAGFRMKVARRSKQHQSADLNHPFFEDPSVYEGAIAVDESSFVSIDTPRRGWALPNVDIPKPAPKKRCRTSLLLAIDEGGVVSFAMKGGSFNSRSYADFVSTLPQNRRLIADNVAFHKSRAAREAASQRNIALEFTPPYCPWFNPVEFAFSSVKRAYRRRRVNGSDDFAADVKTSLGKVTGAACVGYFKHARQNVADEMTRSNNIR